MLKSLKGHDKRTVELVLSAYTSALLPSPGIESRSELPVDSALYESVKEEIHQLLKITPSNLSPIRRAKVFEFLAREMSEVALARADIKSIKERIGQRGDLRSDLYEIQFEDSFHICEKFGVRPSHVTETIRHPDLIDDSSLEFPGAVVVLHVKTHNNNDRNRFSLVVISSRQGSVFQVISAWRIYHADVGVLTRVTPIGLLNALAQTYGVPFRAGSSQGRFLLEVAIEGSVGTPMSEVIKIDIPYERALIHFIGTKSHVLRLYRIGLVFVLDRYKYAADLQKRGVHIRELEDSTPQMKHFLI